MDLGPKKIGYFLKNDHKVDCLLMDLGPNKIGYFLEPNHSIDFFLFLLEFKGMFPPCGGWIQKDCLVSKTLPLHCRMGLIGGFPLGIVLG